jgi:DNA-binding PadR family transcriptional regulator
VNTLIDYIILGFLLGNQMSGYAIKQAITMSTANFYDASFGSIYPALKRLEAKEWIVSTEAVADGKYKKVYKVLEPGKQSFLDWLEEPLVLHPSRNEYLVKLFFYRHLSKEKVQHLVTNFMKLIAERKTQLMKLETVVKPMADFFQLSTLHYGIDAYQFMLAWFEQYLKTVARDSCQEKEPGK